ALSSGWYYYPTDFLVIKPAALPLYVTMDGHASWDRSIAGGADKTNIGDGSLFDSSKNAGGVFSGTASFTKTGASGQYRVTDGSLIGNTANYPNNRADLLAQMFQRYEGKGGTPDSSKTGMGNVLDGLLYTWGASASGPLVKRTIDDFLSVDNGGSKGDQRDSWNDGSANPRGGGSRAGAYQ
ncbi:MAG: hypothetical protein LBL44_04220, partial [Treponema sp.]|nr:hypothetical protein [Treponema sp.]